MSKTDKTRPYWVQMRDSDFPYPLRAFHRHYGQIWRNHPECNIDLPKPITRRIHHNSCEWWPRYRDHDKIWGRGKYRRSREFKQDRRARASLRQLKATWKKEVNREDIDSTENLPTQRWLWRGWYWD